MSNAKMRHLFLTVSLLLVWFSEIRGHGYLLGSRSSRWRDGVDPTAPKNYDDNGLNCGGLHEQWARQAGKCGLCGDPYALSTPRPNEIGGKYGGKGVITRTYTASTATVTIMITTNHLGYIYFDLCNLDACQVESEECFAKYRLLFVDGSDRLHIGATRGKIEVTLRLPEGLRCKHCVLKWTYIAGNNWGKCSDGTSALGCGPQETFKNCQDIAITAAHFSS